jgi:hypothetical protein
MTGILIQETGVAITDSCLLSCRAKSRHDNTLLNSIYWLWMVPSHAGETPIPGRVNAQCITIMRLVIRALEVVSV